VISSSKVRGRGSLCHKKENILHGSSVNNSNDTVFVETGYLTTEEV
jgi:hypothetical protein